ncbi:MAG: KUP/HAK/KT family potassium transporter, partial [Fluviibacter sp.]
ALNPFYAIEFLASHGMLSFFALGAVVLCLTGAEALYADMGHFGPLPIRIVWVGLVMPSLVLNYFGQGALLIDHPAALSNLFYMMAPNALQTPLIILATIATVIASQAVISGAFSMTRQAFHLNLLPRLSVKQTSADEIGQIYLPFVNIALAVSVGAVILLFQSSNALGSAYGIAVTGTMLITDFLAIAVAITVWRWHPLRAFLGAAFFILIDAVFFGANTLKLLDGGWFPILLSLIMIFIMTIWYRGFMLDEGKVRCLNMPLLEFIKDDVNDNIIRTPGSAIYMVGDEHMTSIALIRIVKHFKVLHQTVAVLSVKYELTPYVEEASRVDIRLCDKGFLQIVIRSGFMQRTDIPEILKNHWPASLKLNYEPITFVFRRLSFKAENSNGLYIWRKRFFNVMLRNGALPSEVFCLPESETVPIGIGLKF